MGVQAGLFSLLSMSPAQGGSSTVLVSAHSTLLSPGYVDCVRLHCAFGALGNLMFPSSELG